MSKQQQHFANSWTHGDFRPRIEAVGISGKKGWISVDVGGINFTGTCSKALVNHVIKHSKPQTRKVQAPCPQD